MTATGRHDGGGRRRRGPAANRFEWPLAKPRRQQIHSRLDAHELPVTYQTRRQGSPYTLVLTKAADLHRREARRRSAWQRDLDWLEARGERAARGRSRGGARSKP